MLSFLMVLAAIADFFFDLFRAFVFAIAKSCPSYVAIWFRPIWGLGLIASNVQSNLPQSTVIKWDSNFRKNLKHNTVFVMVSTRIGWQPQTGSTYVMFMYPTLPPNLVQTAEGTLPGQGITITPTQSAAVIGEYSDFAQVSSRAMATAIDDVPGNIGKEMSYQLGQTLSALVRTLADTAYTYDTSARVQLAASSTTVFTTLSLNVIRNNTMSMAGRAIHPLDDDAQFPGVIHPFQEGDVASDTSNNSPIDIAKHTKEGLARIDNFVSTDLMERVEYPSSNARFWRTGLVTTITNYQSVSGLTGLSCYLLGQDGVFSYDMAAPGDTAIDDGAWQGIECYIERNFPKTAYDPAGVIPAAASYKCHFTTSFGPDLTTARLRVIQAASAVS